jgi:hypothetical protein
MRAHPSSWLAVDEQATCPESASGTNLPAKISAEIRTVDIAAGPGDSTL